MEKNVSMPYIGLIPFLRIPSQHPIKSAFPGLILGGISQNILKIMIFHLKNGMFTICSYFYCNTTIFFLLKQVFFHILSLLSQQKITVHWCPVNSNSKNAAVQAPPNFYDIQPFKIACADGPYTREHGFYLKGTMSHGQSGERADLSELSRKNLRSLQVHIQSPFQKLPPIRLLYRQPPPFLWHIINNPIQQPLHIIILLSRIIHRCLYLYPRSFLNPFPD